MIKNKELIDMIGTKTKCKTPITSYVLPAYCFNCDPVYKKLNQKVDISKSTDIPIIITDNKNEGDKNNEKQADQICK